MKEQILSLEHTDDLQSLRDKINRIQAGRLVLLWPALAEPVNRRLDFALIRRWATMAGSELVIVSTDPEVRRLARQSGIPCHPTLKESALAGLSVRSSDSLSGFAIRPSNSRLPGPRRTPPWRELPPALRIGLFGAAISSLVFLFLLLIPSAHLRVVFPTRILDASGNLDPTLCAELTIRLELTDRRTTSGYISTPVTYAVGAIRLTNKSTRLLNLPAGLRVSSESGVSFETIDGVILPAGKSQSMAIRATNPGPSGNLAAGEVDRVDGPLALSLQAVNPDPTSGGADAWRSAVSKSDIDALRSSLSDRAQQEAESGMQNLAATGRTIVNHSLQVQFDSRDTADFSVNTPADTVGLTLHAAASVLACPIEIVRSRAQNILASHLRADEILSPAKLAFRLERNDQGAIVLYASGQATKISDPNSLTLALRGRTPAQVGAILQTQFGARKVAAMDLSPAWLPVLPLFPYQIQITAVTE
jgi:hypothetical protein